MRTTFDHEGTHLTVTVDESGWHVQAGEKVVSAPYVDEVLHKALPGMRGRTRDRLMVRLLQWRYQPRPRPGSGGRRR